MFDALDRFLAARLTGGSDSAAGEHFAPEALIERIFDHGIAALLHAHPGRLEGMPPAVIERVGREARARAMWELRHGEILRTLLRRLKERDVDCLLLKGSALAYSLYDPPSTRARGDSDILIRSGDRKAAQQVLAQQGFVRADTKKATVLQESWVLRLDDHSVHVIDLHWATLNSPFLADVLPYSHMAANADALSELGNHALAPSSAHTLSLLACHWALNRSGTYHVDDRVLLGRTRLIGLWDVHLLVQQMTSDDWREAIDVARSEGLSQTCLALLGECRNLLGTDLPDQVMSQLQQEHISRIEGYLLGRSRWRRMMADLRAIRPRWRAVFYLAARGRSYLRTRWAG